MEVLDAQFEMAKMCARIGDKVNYVLKRKEEVKEEKSMVRLFLCCGMFFCFFLCERESDGKSYFHCPHTTVCEQVFV